MNKLEESVEYTADRLGLTDLYDKQILREQIGQMARNALRIWWGSKQ